VSAAGLAAVLVAVALPLTGCGQTDADVASKNISTEAEQFKVARRIVFINGITDKYLLTITGYCSVETGDSALAGSLEVTCKTGPGAYKKSFLGLSDNVTYMVQQIDPIDVSTSRYKVIFKPSTIIPDIDVK
jgi:hypothetical protein